MRYAINLLGWGELDKGDVVTSDGEYLGQWIANAEYHPGFIPDGHTDVLFQGIFVPLFCEWVQEWADQRG